MGEVLQRPRLAKACHCRTNENNMKHLYRVFRIHVPTSFFGISTISKTLV